VPALPADLDGWLAFVERQHPQAIALGLERVAAVRDALALPKPCPIITVGGTNGKGSVCAMLEAILRAAGHRVGTYTSPHLLRYNERVRLDGRDVHDARLVEAYGLRVNQATLTGEAMPALRTAGYPVRWVAPEGLHLTLKFLGDVKPDREAELLAIDEALTRLADHDERAARVVELHYFGGLTYDEIAEALGVSAATVDRDLRFAKAWLYRELKDGG